MTASSGVRTGAGRPPRAHRAHRFGGGAIQFDDPHLERGYSRAAAYGQTKPANLMFTDELQRRLTASTSSTIAVAAHPGFSNTDLARNMPAPLRGGVALLSRLLSRPAAMGALSTLRAASGPSTLGGLYYGPGGFQEMTGHPVVVGSSGERTAAPVLLFPRSAVDRHDTLVRLLHLRRPADRTERIRLSRERVLAGAVALADEGGVDALTIRPLAEHLGVKPMALYHDVAYNSEILDGLVDLVYGGLREIELPQAEGDWRTEIRLGAHSARHVLRRHPWAGPLLQSRTAPGAATLNHHDAILGSLRGAGFSVRMTGHAYALLDSCIYGVRLWARGHSRRS